MGLRCTVLGHAWSDPQMEREREESDAEVVTTVREFKECKRCGSREVVSENVEVTSQAAASRQPETTGGPGTDADDGAVIEDAETGERTVVEGSAADDPSGESAEGTTDDGAVILDDDTAEREREPGEWPEHDVDEADDTGPAEPPSWPDHDDGPADDEAPSDEDAAGAENGDRPDPADGERGSGAATDEAPATSGSEAEATADGTGPTSADAGDAGGHVVADGEEDEVEVITSDPTPSGSEGAATPQESGGPTTPSGSETTPSGSDTTPSGDPVDPAEALSEAAADQESDDGPVEPTVEADVDIEVVCPNCGFLDEGPSPSLRGGDSCPKCRRAYLEEREM